MGWEDRRYEPAGDGGKFRAVIRRIFGDGENPIDWSIPLYTAWRIRVKIHLVFVFLIAAELIQAAAPNGIGFWHRAIGIACLFVLVLLHEYGHCIACRRIGGTADQILMWPLGGLAYCLPPSGWRASLITVLGGPAVNALLWPVFGAALIVLGQGWGAVAFNPFDPRIAVSELHATNNRMLRVVWWVWWLYYTNAILFLFNMLVPMYPMDGSRVVLAVLWRKIGYLRAASIMVRVGWFCAIAMGVYGAATGQTLLLSLALFGGVMCFMERRRLAMMTDDTHPALAGYDFERGYQGMPAEDEQEPEKQRNKRRKKEDEDQQELDRILAKIKESGMGSLTRSEKRWLEEASARRRGA
jgi:Zn-dependent protease